MHFYVALRNLIKAYKMNFFTIFMKTFILYNDQWFSIDFFFILKYQIFILSIKGFHKCNTNRKKEYHDLNFPMKCIQSTPIVI